MDDVFSAELFPDPRQKVCRNCPSSYQCAILDACLKLLDSVSERAGGPAWDLSRTLRARIEDHGYAYPLGQRLCSLANRPDQVGELIESSLATLQAISHQEEPASREL